MAVSLEKNNIGFNIGGVKRDIGYDIFSKLCEEKLAFYKNGRMEIDLLNIFTILLRNQQDKITANIVKFFFSKYSYVFGKYPYMLFKNKIEREDFIKNNDNCAALHLAAFNGQLKEYCDLIPSNSASFCLFSMNNSSRKSLENIQQFVLTNFGKRHIRNYEVMDLQTTKFLVNICRKYFKDYKDK